jgi:hypothetical protein
MPDVYDRYGNRWHQNGQHSSQLGFNANNYITTVSGLNYGFTRGVRLCRRI